MKRRSFLKTAAAVFPAAGLQAFALSQATAPSSAAPVQKVGSGQDMFGESRSRGFSTILFKVAPRETGGGLFLIEHTNLVKGGPPLHLHPHPEEWFCVVEGEVLFQIGDRRERLQAGESILGPRNIPHCFSSAGEKPGRMLIAFTPAGKMEEFFRATAVPNPPADQGAEFHRRFEIELIGPSPFTS
jgi:mannose-6-phosphate isomerase-like protein (cupin superfamily)